jgi:hypothetical protein
MEKINNWPTLDLTPKLDEKLMYFFQLSSSLVGRKRIQHPMTFVDAFTCDTCLSLSLVHWENTPISHEKIEVDVSMQPNGVLILFLLTS